jgi:hypothetical protein
MNENPNSAGKNIPEVDKNVEPAASVGTRLVAQMIPEDVVRYPDGQVDLVQTALNKMRKDEEMQPKRGGLAEMTKWLKENDIDSPRCTFFERMKYWVNEEWYKIQDLWRALKKAPQFVRSKSAEITMLAAILLIIGLLCVVGHGVLQRLLENRQIRPDEDSTTVLHFTRLHWFSSNEEILLEARPDPDDQNIVKWMAKASDGTWYPFFHFDDE